MKYVQGELHPELLVVGGALKAAEEGEIMRMYSEEATAPAEDEEKPVSVDESAKTGAGSKVGVSDGGAQGGGGSKEVAGSKNSKESTGQSQS